MGSLFQTPLTSFTEQRARAGFEPGTSRTQSENHTRSEEHTSELQSHLNLVCRLLLEKKKTWRGVARSSSRENSEAASIVLTRARALASRYPRATGQPGVLPQLAALFFFFMNTATPELSLLPLPAALRI